MGRLNARLAKLEQSCPSGAGRCIVLPMYEGESNSDVYAAYPEIKPGPHDMVVICRQFDCKRGEGPVFEPRIWPLVQ